jgi:hypothetical protein
LPADAEARIELIRNQLANKNDVEAFTRPHYYLSISGGGANGAFGAGLR